MRGVALAVVGLLSVSVAGCHSAESTAPADVTAEARAIMQLESNWSDMFGAGDLEGISGLLTDDTVLIIPGTPPITGFEAVRESTRAMLASDDQVSWRSIKATVAPSGDMAWDYGMATTKLADGTVVEGYYLVVWEKQGGQWRVAADMFN